MRQLSLAVLILFGLSHQTLAQQPSQTPDLRGRWKAVLQLPEDKADKDSPNFGSAFAKMMLQMMGSIKLKIGDNNAYTLTMMGIPLEGHYVADGLKLRFSPERAAGRTAAEWEKESKGASKQMEPMDAVLSPDLESLTFLSNSPEKSQSLIFKRLTQVDETRRAVNVKAAAERTLVGHWNGTIELPKNATKPKDATEAAMAQMILSSFELDLHQDKTFELSMMLDLSGKWEIVGDSLVLHPTAIQGMETDNKTPKKEEDLKLTIQPNGTLVGADAKDGTKTTFVKGSL